MPNQPGWGDIALRLLLTVVAGTVIGFNRGEHGRASGLRTTLLVCLAAAVTMIQVNLLLPIAGKARDSYVVMDLMRLPLGILSGMGFIGAGAILRRDNLVVGVTTAATLWFVTIVGLCFGGGQLGLGTVALALGFIVLQALKPIENSWHQDRYATLAITTRGGGLTEREIIALVGAESYRVTALSLIVETDSMLKSFECVVSWRGRPHDICPPSFVAELAGRRDTVKVGWRT